MPTVTGIGLGLRPPSRRRLRRARRLARWLEVSPENYIGSGPYASATSTRPRALPIVTHGLTLCPGNVDPPTDGYMATLSAFLARRCAPWHSDHLCFGSRRRRAPRPPADPFTRAC